MTTYFLSGLGADKGIFSKLVLPSRLKIVYINWLPHRTGESLQSYTRRIAEQIDSTEPFQLVGVSFGGIVATELSKILKPKQIVIISSISIKKQLPAYFTLSAGILKNPFFPKSVLKSASPLSYWLFGAVSKQSKNFFKQTIEQTNENFLKWAIEKIMLWDNKTKADNLYHIHGTEDKIFPIMYLKPDYAVKGGEHLMVYDMSREISKLLTRVL